jgi:dUTPase
LFKIFRIPLNSEMRVPMPEYMTPGAAAMDFYSTNIEPMIINPGQTVLIPLGIKVAIAPGYKLTLKPRFLAFIINDERKIINSWFSKNIFNNIFFNPSRLIGRV